MVAVINFVWRAVGSICLPVLLVFVLAVVVVCSALLIFQSLCFVEWNTKSTLQFSLAAKIDWFLNQFRSFQHLWQMEYLADVYSAEYIFQLRLGVAVSKWNQIHNLTNRSG